MRFTRSSFALVDTPLAYPACELRFNELQLSLNLETSDGCRVANMSYWQRVSVLEREAESALFDWLENRDAPYASVLWNAFAIKAELLTRVLLRKSE